MDCESALTTGRHDDGKSKVRPATDANKVSVTKTRPAYMVVLPAHAPHEYIPLKAERGRCPVP